MFGLFALCLYGLEAAPPTVRTTSSRSSVVGRAVSSLYRFPLPFPPSLLKLCPFILAAQVNTMIWGGVADVDGGGGTTRGYFPESEDPQLKLRSNSGAYIHHQWQHARGGASSG